ncbi:hypothetical protein E2C01_040075 [Portunus trituberculatus]|uniref:Uncharacterized protein n=1 Tax=Portunus trituberculatus TaxID=210409 RepID=A0A5B7FLH3_PORTR|nr:hypothetical protein [Portunus trituberculatus]
MVMVVEVVEWQDGWMCDVMNEWIVTGQSRECRRRGNEREKAALLALTLCPYDVMSPPRLPDYTLPVCWLGHEKWGRGSPLPPTANAVIRRHAPLTQSVY